MHMSGLSETEESEIPVGQDQEIGKKLLPEKDSYNSFEKVLFTEASGTVSQNIWSEETLKSQIFQCFEAHIT